MLSAVSFFITSSFWFVGCFFLFFDLFFCVSFCWSLWFSKKCGLFLVILIIFLGFSSLFLLNTVIQKITHSVSK